MSTKAVAKKPESKKAPGVSGSGMRSRIGASRLSGSSRRDNTAGGGQGQSIQIMFKGRDVTPQSLLIAKQELSGAPPTAAGNKGAVAASRGVESSAGGPEASIGRLSSGISRSGLSVSSSRGDSDEESGFDLSSGVTVEPSIEKSILPEPDTDAGVEDVDVELTEAELSANVELQLEETETVILFSLPSLRVLQDTDEFAHVTARNEKYAALCGLQLGGGDNFSSRHTQTLNNAQKNKEVSATPAPTRDAGSTAAAWDIFDALNNEDATVGADADVDVVGKGVGDGSSGAVSSDPRAQMSDLEKAVDEAVSSSIATPGCLLDAEGTVMIAPPLGWEDPSLGDPVMSRKTPGGKGGSSSGPGVSRGDKNTLNSSSAVGVSVGITQSTNRSAAPKKSTNTGMSDTQRSSVGGKTRTLVSSGSRGPTASGSSQSSRPSGVVIPTKPAPGPTGGDGSDAIGGGWSEPKDSKDILLARETSRVLSSRSLLDSLHIVERALQQNVFHAAHRMYKAVSGVEMLESLVSGTTATPKSGDGESDGKAAGSSGGRLVKLWSYSCPLSEGRSVSCLAWNRLNPDLLAVAYTDVKPGTSSATPASGPSSHPGIVLFWSMSNPGFPQAVLYATSGVTSISFSATHPNLIAAGLQDGSVCIYDVKKAISGEGDGTADLLARPLDGSHTDAVWQLQWIEKSQGRGERLLSISADGKVKEWSTKKGLVCTDLMVLKRVRADGAEPAHEEKSDGVISRVDAGLCFDFPPGDPSLYFTGTEDGVVHHCSVSYGEQLESFRAHSGPVYRLKISPFLSQAVITCSADWSVKLWDIGSGLPPCVFQTTDSLEAVTDVCWSKTHSTRFASVTGDGRIMLWDTSSFTPLIDHRVDDPTASGSPVGSLLRRKRLTTVLFAHDTPVLVTGDGTGSVDVYRVVGLPPPPPTVDEQVEALSKSLHPA